MPRRLEPGCAEADYPASPLDHYRRIYFVALDLIVSSIKSRFEQPGYQNYRHLQDLLLNVARHREYRPDFDFVTQFYGNDLSPALLDAQLQVFATKFEENSEPSLLDIIEELKKFTAAEKELLNKVCTLFKLILVMPATNAVSERSFSTLRRIKTLP